MPAGDPRAFLRKLAAEIERQLAPDLRGLKSEPHGHLLKLWYGKEGHVHYEIAFHPYAQLLEIGLHCEAHADYNEAIRRGLIDEIFEIKHQLGYRVEVEPWARGWSRVYETHALLPLDDQRLADLAERCAIFITHMQPIYETIVATLPPSKPRLNVVNRG